MNTSTQALSYKDSARNKFQDLKEIYTASNNGISFWKLGNTFDTLIDGLEHIDSSDANTIANAVITNFDTAFDAQGINGTWFDDYGWWCVAFKRALEKSFFASHRAVFQQKHDFCWKQFSENAPYVWERRKPGTFNTCGPAITGGIWNEYWAGTSDEYPGPSDGDPSNGTLHGVQNTVTNAVYLMSAQRQSTRDAQEQANKERDFLFKWMWQKDSSLWWEINKSAALVRERVGHFAGTSNPAPGFMSDWAWAGDQGLMLSNLYDSLSHIDPVYRQGIISNANSILNGARDMLTKSPNGIIQNSTNETIAPAGDTSDYLTGTSIFWRNILHIWKATTIFRPTLTSTDYQQIMRASANDAQSPGTSADELTNQLATLITVSEILT